MPDALAEHLRSVGLIDHHVHGNFNKPVDRAGFEAAINEGSTDPVPGFMTQFDSPLGFPFGAGARRCSALTPLRGRRRLLGAAQRVHPRRAGQGHAARRGRVALDRRHRVQGRPDHHARASSPSSAACRRRRSSGSNGSPRTCWRRAPPPTTTPRRSGRRCARPRESGRGGHQDDRGLPQRLRHRLVPPADADVVAQARELGTGPRPLRLDSPVLIAFAVHEAAAHGLPIQVHVGFGDRDLDLHRCDPMLLLPLLRTMAPVPVLLLHCYPFQRQAGYLAQAFDHVNFDVGLAINYLGVAVDRAGRRGARDRAVRQAAVLVGRLRPARTARAGLGAVAPRNGPGARRAGCVPVTAPRTTPSGSST